ncbi:hypothetical protein WJX72_006425 [[Myrmecia] bisecta]|uniref:LON peptidase N-terminal domain and RING finger protein 1 n=1 Tax=[Myrmecia] bisecta TaxID=41462 RepID=A0AAW1PGE1_9CHLO
MQCDESGEETASTRHTSLQEQSVGDTSGGDPRRSTGNAECLSDTQSQGQAESDRDESGHEAAGPSSHHPPTGAAAGKLEGSIHDLTMALKAASDTAEEAELLCKRSAAFANLSRVLRDRSAAQSEAHALFGVDPFHLAQLALRDAQKAISLQPKWPTAYFQQGAAYCLLEAYDDAERSFLDGLSEEPSNHKLQNALCDVRRMTAGSRACRSSSPKRARRTERLDDFECVLCMKLLFEPVTTPCGHTFCRACFMRATDHGNKCPMCRTVLHVGRELPLSVTLNNILEKSFPEEYQQRRRETRSLPSEVAGEAPLPLFVMSCMMPGEKMALNIFEPRYRLMVRRCMEGNRRFGMATVSADHELHGIGCECEILECQPLPDGRFYLEIVGRQRFRLLDSFEQDGYRMARPQYFSDDTPEPDSQLALETAAVASSVEGLADAWVERVKAIAMGRRGMRVLELLHRAGDKPSSAEYERISFWVANLMPMDTADRLRLLGMTSTLERLQFEKDLLQRTDSGPGGCSVM